MKHRSKLMNLLSEQQLKDLRGDIAAIIILATCANIGLTFLGLAYIANGLGI